MCENIHIKPILYTTVTLLEPYMYTYKCCSKYMYIYMSSLDPMYCVHVCVYTLPQSL